MQVEAAMKPYENTIKLTDMTAESMTLKKTFTKLTPVLMQGLCQPLAFGQPAVLAKGALANVQGVMQVKFNCESIMKGSFIRPLHA